MNVLAAGFGSPPQGVGATVGGSHPSVSYTFDLLITPTNPPGAFTGAQLAAPYVGTSPAGATSITGPGGVALTVTVVDQGATPGASTQGGVGHVAPTPATWTRASTGTVINPGDGVRVSVASGDFAQLASSLNLPLSAAGFQQFLALSKTLGATNATAWAPGDALPGDWPGDDPQPASEYHAQFVFNGPAPITVQAWSITPIIWTKSGGVGGWQQLGGVGVQGSGTGNAQTGGGAPSTAPQTAHLTPPSPAGGIGQVNITGAAPGTPITVVIDGGGSFSYVNSTNVDPGTGGYTQTSGFPMQPPPSLPWFVYTTPASAGVIDILWADSSGTKYHSQVRYGQ